MPVFLKNIEISMCFLIILKIQKDVCYGMQLVILIKQKRDGSKARGEDGMANIRICD